MTLKTLKQMTTVCVYLMVFCLLLTVWMRDIIWALIDAAILFLNLQYLKMIDKMIEAENNEVGKGD